MKRIMVTFCNDLTIDHVHAVFAKGCVLPTARRIMAALKELKFHKNALVIFTSDISAAKPAAPAKPADTKAEAR